MKTNKRKRNIKKLPTFNLTCQNISARNSLSLSGFCVFRRGSIEVEFQLIFKSEVTEEVALAELKRETANGKLGRLGVDPTSLKATTPKQGDVLPRPTLNCELMLFVLHAQKQPYIYWEFKNGA